ncbi:cupredoxin domain-containing protein [Candidatus Falkowbacteria bacterium]|nr:MAG: cupredoxin domain-containing protein [Candidatus Falkowbacteria bacterium]
MNKKNIIFAGIVIALIGGIIVLSNITSQPKVVYYGDSNNSSVEPSTNVSMDGEKQIVEITAKGGYSPSKSSAKAGVPTIIRVITNGTYDCSSALRIKSLGYSKNLPATGTTDIEVPPQVPGTTIKALCSMGMYNFTVQFNS